MRILYVTTIGRTMAFFDRLVKKLVDGGHSVDIACSEPGGVPAVYKELGCAIYEMSWSRSPIDPGNLKAISQLRELAEGEGYDVVHCHTPIASACARAACKGLRRAGALKVVYTAHGFHFYKGAPVLNWVLYYLVERLCSRWTDVLVAINDEDYERARVFHARELELVPGVGIDGTKFRRGLLGSESRLAKRRSLGVAEGELLVLSVGELNRNKNHISALKALESIDGGRLVYAIAGEGDQRGELESYARNHQGSTRLLLLGRRGDVAELYSAADIYIHPSYREGLPVSLMEAVACGCYAVASDIRGCKDILPATRLFDPSSVDSIASAVRVGLEGGLANELNLSESFYGDCIDDLMIEIYKRCLRM